MANLHRRRLLRRTLIALAVCYLAAMGDAMLPPSPIQCDGGRNECTLSNSYGVWPDREPCRVSAVFFPTTEAELRSAVADAVKKGLKLKVVSKFSHTIPKFACPQIGVPNALISTERYNQSIDVDEANLAVTADAGVGLRELIDRVEAAGLSLAVAPYWEGVSVAGMISTGAHGSSWRGRGGAVHDHVTAIRLIIPATASEGFAKIVDLKNTDPLLNAAKVSLGLLGAISKVTFSLEPGFKRRVTFNYTNDNGIENEFMNHGKKYEFGDIQWYPSRHSAVYRYDDRVPIDTPGDGLNDFIGFQPNLITISQSLRASEKAAENTKSVDGKCVLASTFVAYKKLVANGFKNNKLVFTGYPVIGRQGKIQTSGSCLYSSSPATACAWDPRIKGLSFYESAAIFPATRFRDFIADVKKLRDINPRSFCGADIYNGFLIRYVPRSAAYLAAPEDSVVVDFNYYRADDAATPRLHQDVWEEVEQMAFFGHGARPHWGKNRHVAFTGAAEKYPKLREFVAAKAALDPANVFSSDWSERVMAGNGGDAGDKEDGCALEGRCVCSEDRHCSPKNGYFCQHGRVYTLARVCRYSSNSTFSII
ncbi:L-gulonolactone oxidase 3 [Andrographis paniculata]|uniref:L-gulonolactone oxidase 3 n=1 Tax=Andrographis paniculata TaxID=175694 RepID=UPI0021E962EB|nr:L-gulonolactone oxidase 3 [Andrographis paniculata]